MAKISLPDFFKYFDPNNANQLEAVVLLESMMPDSLLQDEPKPSSWVLKYREKPEVPPSVVPKQCLDIIAEFEGFRSSPYLCPAGIPTIAYGATYYPDGRKVQMSDPPVGQEKGREMLAWMVEKDFWNVLKVTVPYWDQMNDNQKSAITSFAYNLGAHFYGSPGFNTVSACLRDRAWGEVPSALMLYVNPGSAFEAGLRRRRETEGQLWNS